MRKTMIISALLLAVLIFLLLFFAGCGSRAEQTGLAIPDSRESIAEETGYGVSRAFTGVKAGQETAVIYDTVADVFEHADIQSKRLTQAIYNQPAEILERTETWTKIRTPDGTAGWVKTKYLTADRTSITGQSGWFKIIITAKTAGIFSSNRGGITIKEVVMGTELYTEGIRNDAYAVILPGQMKGWVKASSAIRTSDENSISRTSGSDFAATARKFKGTSYLQGGVSALGVDCSGLIYICSRINGIDMPRKLEEQIGVGKNVDVERMETGDLIFFTSAEDREDITDAGIYLGDMLFIHAGRVKGYVTIDNLNDTYFSKKLAGTRRIFD